MKKKVCVCGVGLSFQCLTEKILLRNRKEKRTDFTDRRKDDRYTVATSHASQSTVGCEQPFYHLQVGRNGCEPSCSKFQLRRNSRVIHFPFTSVWSNSGLRAGRTTWFFPLLDLQSAILGINIAPLFSYQHHRATCGAKDRFPASYIVRFWVIAPETGAHALCDQGRFTLSSGY